MSCGVRDHQDVGTSAAKRVLKQILRRGCVGSRLQAVVPLLMVLTPEDVSRVRLGKKLSSDWYGGVLTVMEIGARGVHGLPTVVCSALVNMQH
jgi:hypothetical protein